MDGFGKLGRKRSSGKLGVWRYEFKKQTLNVSVSPVFG